MIRESQLDQLIQAARYQQWDKVDELVTQGQPINEIDPKTGRTVLSLLAQETGSYPIIEALIKRGANPKYAIEGVILGSYPTLRQILLEDYSQHLNTAVYTAAWCNDGKLVQALIRKGAERQFAHKGAARGAHQELRQQLMKAAVESDSPVLKAGLSGDKEAAGRVFAESVDLKEDDKFKDTTQKILQGFGDLMGGVFKHLNDQFDVYELALGGHAEELLNYLQLSGDSSEAVRGAAVGGHHQLVSQLLDKKKAKVSEAIWGTAFRGQTERVNLLMQRDPGSTRTLLNKAIEGAAAGGHSEFVQELLTKGASLDLAIAAAKEFGHTRLVDTLSQDELWTKEDEELLGSLLNDLGSKGPGF